LTVFYSNFIKPFNKKKIISPYFPINFPFLLPKKDSDLKGESSPTRRRGRLHHFARELFFVHDYMKWRAGEKIGDGRG